MENTTELGFNRTGAQSSPLSVHSMQIYADEQSPHAPPTSDGMPDGKAIASVRSLYVAEAERVGSVPMPGTVTGAFNTVLSHLRGRNPEVLVDKLGERLAFERAGVRLYQALIDKANALGGLETLPFTIADLQHIRDEELEHMHVVASALESLGADPSAQTPSADISAVASMGVMQVLTDPRTTIAHGLEAILIAELTDCDSWDLLVSLTEQAGQDTLLPDFRRAMHNENAHLLKVRGWLRSVVLGEGG